MTDSRRRALLLISLVLTGLHFVYSGIYSPATNGSWGQLRDNELPALIEFVLRGQPVTTVDPRQYGVVSFLVVHPLLITGRGDLRFVELALLGVAHVCILTSFLLIWRHFFQAGRSMHSWILFFIWYNFEPTYGILATKNVESWELLLLTVGLISFTADKSSIRVRSGLTCGVACLTKLLPLVVLGFLAIRDRIVFAAGALTITALLLVGQLLYGDLMGLGYFPHIARNAEGVSGSISTWWENNAIPGIVHKLFAWFRMENYNVVVPAQFRGVADITSMGLSGMVLAYLAWIAWRGRASESSAERRALEFSIALVAMLLVSPNTHQDYMLLALPAFASAMWLRSMGWPAPWPRRATAALVGGVVLIGQILPTRVLVIVVPGLSALADASGLTIGQVYLFYLFPAAGLLCLAALLVWLEVGSRAASPSDLIVQDSTVGATSPKIFSR